MSGTPSISIKLNSVRTQKSPVAIIKGPTENDPPYQTENLVLWAASPVTQNPATISLMGAALIVNVTATYSQDFDLTLSGTAQGRQIGVSERVRYPKGASSLDIFVPITPLAAPWGFNGQVQWTYNVFLGSQNWKQTDQTPVQLYAVVGEMTPMYTNSGIPEEMLDLFVAQYPNSGSSSIEQWVTWAVKRCFASHTEDNTPDQLQDVTPIHSYSYNTYSGANRFSPRPLEFDLMGWLKLREENSDLITVNCYDQAGLVVCALSLGLPYYMRDRAGKVIMTTLSSDTAETKMTTLQRYYKGTESDSHWDRFGFISKTNLIGWGECNSPFFSGNTENMIVDSTNTRGVERTSFRNHKFVRYNTLDLNGKVVGNALDACAGPHAAIVPLETYLAEAIDQVASANYVTDEEKKAGKSWSLMGQVGTYAPTESINVRTLFRESAYSGPKGDLWNTLTEAQGKREPSTNPTGATFTNLSAFLQKDIQVQTGPFDVEVGKNRTTIIIEFSHVVNGKPAPFVTATIDVMKNFDQAKLQAETRQFVFERNWRTMFAVPSKSQYLGDINLVRKPGGDLNVALIVYGNVVVYFEGEYGPDAGAQFDALVTSFDKYMKQAMATGFSPANPADLKAPMPTTISVGVPFDVVIAGPGMTELDVAAKQDIIRITQGPVSTPGGGWKMSCTSLRAGDDEVAFGFAQTGTYFPYTDLVVPITVTPSPNLIPNGDFQTGTLTPWSVELDRSTINIVQPGFGKAKYKAVAAVRQQGRGPYSALTLRQTLPVVQGKTYKISVQVSFSNTTSRDCYVNIFAYDRYVVSQRSDVGGVVEQSNTFWATSNQVTIAVGLLCCNSEQMDFSLGYVKMELVP